MHVYRCSKYHNGKYQYAAVAIDIMCIVKLASGRTKLMSSPSAPTIVLHRFPAAVQAKTRLRVLGLPITIFGETRAQRSARLLQAEEDKGHHQDDYTLADGHNVVSKNAVAICNTLVKLTIHITSVPLFSRVKGNCSILL